RAVRRGLTNMRIQAYLTAAAINLKRLAAALFAPFVPWLARLRPISVCTPSPNAWPMRATKMLEERAPATLVLLRPLANAENLPIAALVHADCNQERDVAYLAGPAALEHDAIEINIRVLALDRTIAPGLDCPVDLLVQVRHRRVRHPRPPQCLRDVLAPAHRYPGQIHLDQRLLHRALAPPIALDDSRLERLLAQLRYPQPYLASLGLQAALVVASAGIAT